LVGKSAGKKPLGRPKLRGEDKVKRDVKRDDVVAQDWDKWRAFCEHGNELSGFMKCRGSD
jgi:hypothetical protein